jgi:hypothetical protein
VRKGPATLACIALGGGAVALALATPGPEVTGCTTHQCDQSSYDWFPLDAGRGPGGGFMVDEDTYFSNDPNQPWLVYHGNTTVRFWFPPEVAGRTAEVPQVFVGIDQMPNSPDALDSGANYTQGVGQLAIFNTLSTQNPDGAPGPYEQDGHLVGGGFMVTNSSCASYFAHVEVHFAHLDTPTIDGPEGGGPMVVARAGDAGSD